MADTLATAGTGDEAELDKLPPRPPMPTPEDQARAEHQFARWQVLNEDFDDLLADWLAEHIDGDRLEVWGPPDTSVNPLADQARQLTTPGLYGVRPRIVHSDPMAEALVGPDGFLDEAGLFTKLQQVQYFAVGLGDFLVRLDVLQRRRRLSVRLVAPHNVYMRADPEEPDRPIELWELRIRWFEERAAWIWTWDVFKLSDPDHGDEPSYKVIAASTGEVNLDNEDLSAVYLATPGNEDGDFTGDRYPYRFAPTTAGELGGPFLPWVVYRAIDTGQLWNQQHRRGAYHGTLNSALNWSYAQHAARDASGSTTFVVGVDPPATGTKSSSRDGDGRGRGSGSVQTFQATPGSAWFLQPTESGVQPQFHETGPGTNLESVAAYATLYEQKQAVRSGISPADIIRSNANPMSGAALFITDRGRRVFSKQVEPLFRRADTETIAKSGAMLTAARIGAFPVDGYSVAYHQIPDSPAEELSKREQADWDLEHGATTPIKLVQDRRPGISDEDAARLIVRSRVEAKELERMVEQELERRGLTDTDTDTDGDELDGGDTDDDLAGNGDDTDNNTNSGD